MRIVPFPSEQPLPGQEAFIAELEAALAGDLRSPAGEGWRELREDVRALAPPMSPALQARLERERLARTPSRRQRISRRRSAAFAGGLAVAVALVVAVVIATPPKSNQHPQLSQPAQRLPGASGSKAASTRASTPNRGNAARAEDMGPASSAAASAPAAGGSLGASSALGRVQQLAASITLGSSTGEVQSISDQVSQLAVREGGYVQSANVHVQQQGASESSPQGEATLSLRIPSAKLGAALAALGRLAPVRAESQSLEDITSSYQQAHRRLSDALAERSALLHALAAATTEAQIDSLRERLADARAAIARAQAAVNAVSQRASTAEVEVSVLADQHATNEGLTLHRGLHDAGRVLEVALIVALIAGAVLVPLALLAAALMLARNAWRHHQRERALGAS